MKKFLFLSLILIVLVLCVVSCKSEMRRGSIPAEEPTPDTPTESEVPAERRAEVTLPVLETGRYYHVTSGSQTAFVMIDSQEEGSAAGHFYATDEGPWAQPHAFTTKQTKRNLTVTVDSVEQRYTIRKLVRTLSVKPYDEPPYTENTDFRYQRPSFKVAVTDSICYGHATGYWASLSGFEDKSYAKVVLEGFRKSLSKRPLNLCLDLYQPVGVEGRKPLILFIHGGAFYVGDRKNEPIVGYCRHFASLGYVVASIDYRLGFLPSKDDIERAGYMAAQDANAAMRFLVTHADEYGIDTEQIYAAGTSAGAITALNLAFMRDDSRPKASYGRREGLFRHGERTEDLGSLTASGNDLQARFHIRAVANMWGAVNNLDILRNSHTDIISFHGDADQLVPIDKGYPFTDVNENVGQRLFAEMYGSRQIDKRAHDLGLRSRFHSFPGEGHAFHVDKDQKINANWYFIRDSITTFFYEEMVPVRASLTPAAGRLASATNDNAYTVTGPDIATVEWKVDGGFVLESSKDVLRVLWRGDEDKHVVHASGTYRNTLGWSDALTASPKDEFQNN